MKTAVITGSTRGLGLEMAQLFHKKGWNVVLNGVNPQRLATAMEQLRPSPAAGRWTALRAASPRRRTSRR